MTKINIFVIIVQLTTVQDLNIKRKLNVEICIYQNYHFIIEYLIIITSIKLALLLSNMSFITCNRALELREVQSTTAYFIHGDP